LSIARVTISTGERRDVTDPTDAHRIAGLSSAGAGMVGWAGRGCGGVAYLSSGFNASTSLFLWGGPHPSTTREVTHDTPPPAFGSFVKPQLVSFPTLDGTATLHAQLFPSSTGLSTGLSSSLSNASLSNRSLSNGSLSSSLSNPSAIFTHGGSQRQMYAAMHYSSAYAQLYTYCQQLAMAGVTVLSINYRSGVGYGRDFRLCGPPTGRPTKRCGMYGALEYEDIRAGRAWLRKQWRIRIPTANSPQAKEPAVGIFGLSYGGLNCLQALSRDPSDYHAGACNAPVFNWVSQLRYDGATFFDPAPKLPVTAPHQLPIGPESTSATPAWLASTQSRQALPVSSSPVSHMANITGPLLLIHGDLDEEVPYQESLSLARALRRRLTPDKLETLFFPDECHGECSYANQLVAQQATAAFLAKHLL